jgi:hypothetical protein
MFKTSFHLESEARRGKDGSRVINVKFSYGLRVLNENGKLIYAPLKFSTKETIVHYDKAKHSETQQDYWSQDEHRANRKYINKFGLDLNTRLNTIEKAGKKVYDAYMSDNTDLPDRDVLRNLIYEELGWKEKTVAELRIVDFARKWVESRSKQGTTTGGKLSERSVKDYKNLIEHLKAYQRKRNVTLTFGSLNETTYLDYFETISELHREKSGNLYTITTIAKDYKNLRAILREAANQDISIGFNWFARRFKISEPTESRYSVYLSEEQLQHILDFDTRGYKELVHARNYIIISCFTGLRIADMMQLHMLKPIMVSGHDCFETDIRKATLAGTTLKVTIPILRPVKKILEENDNCFPKFVAEKNVRKNIKRLLKELDFSETVRVKTLYYPSETVHDEQPLYEVFTPHDCRKTFISNLAKLRVLSSYYEPITHPKFRAKSTVGMYDKTTREDKALMLVEELNSKTSQLFRC